MKVGVHVSVPAVWPGLVVNTALLPLGSADRLAVSEPIASPSGSVAVNV